MTQLWPPRLAPELDYISAQPSVAYCGCRRRKLVVLGSTGSIGKNALAVAAKAEMLVPYALACGRNIALLAEQAAKFRPHYLAVLEEALAIQLKTLLPRAYNPQILFGPEGYATLAALPEADCVLSAQSGVAGLCGTLAAALAGKVIALANKESLVTAGGLLRQICQQTGAAILPVDSEHYAIFQCLLGRPGQTVKKLILTASGGPFLNQPPEQIAVATPALALRHPNWKMGAKISIDSASLMNKGLEFIEAMQLYGLSHRAIQVLIHPQSIVHSLVEFTDNSVLGQFAVPDMRLPIAACLLWPHASQSFIQELDLTGTLTFHEPDLRTFACLGLAMRSAAYVPAPAWRKIGLNPACIVLNAANEAAVELYLAEKCLFGQIPRFIDAALCQLVDNARPIAPQLPCSADIPGQAIGLVASIAGLDIAARELVRSLILSNN